MRPPSLSIAAAFMSASPARPVRTALMALLLASLFSIPAHSAGLGELIVHSALGQPLEAKAEITGLRGKEFESLSVAPAAAEAYAQRGLRYTAVSRNIRYTPVRREDGSAYLAITSTAPINEPTVDLLVDFAWPGGRLLQKYVLLLDLPLR